MAEFIGRALALEPQEDLRTWELYTNGASNKKGSSAGVVLRTLDGVELEKAVAFSFKTLNNEIEYEALVISIQLTKVCRATVLKAYYDSQLVMDQVQGKFEVKEASMKSYRTIV